MELVVEDILYSNPDDDSRLLRLTDNSSKYTFDSGSFSRNDLPKSFSITMNNGPLTMVYGSTENIPFDLIPNQ